MPTHLTLRATQQVFESAGLAEAQLQRFVDALETVTFAEGAAIVRQGACRRVASSRRVRAFARASDWTVIAFRRL